MEGNEAVKRESDMIKQICCYFLFLRSHRMHFVLTIRISTAHVLVHTFIGECVNSGILAKYHQQETADVFHSTGKLRECQTYARHLPRAHFSPKL